MNRSVEDYIKVILTLGGDKRYVGTVEVARQLEIKAPSVTQMFKRLNELGLVTYKPRIGVKLSDKGFHEAAKILRRNLIFRVFLTEILGLSEEEAVKEACKLEHVVTDEVLERILKLISSKEKITQYEKIISE
ncbi:MAG: metal-dependent transcriptional regulator [Candidatus Baldrarchaeia archaeon]|mgnify:CR=1 FL=1